MFTFDVYLYLLTVSFDFVGRFFFAEAGGKSFVDCSFFWNKAKDMKISSKKIRRTTQPTVMCFDIDIIDCSPCCSLKFDLSLTVLVAVAVI